MSRLGFSQGFPLGHSQRGAGLDVPAADVDRAVELVLWGKFATLGSGIAVRLAAITTMLIRKAAAAGAGTAPDFTGVVGVT